MPVLRPRLSRDGRLEGTLRGWRFSIPPGSAGSYRLSQLDDQAGRARRDYPWRPPQTLSLRARSSMVSGPGTWGFGFWNDPYGFSLGPGELLPRLPTLPQAAWFFAASPACYLSFRDDKPYAGFYAQVFSSGRFGPKLLQAALVLPVAPRTTRRIVRDLVAEDGAAAGVDPRDWHTYVIDWAATGCTFQVDSRTILEAAISPKGPLGLVVWIDNQYAAFDPGGHIRWGVEATEQEQWLEIQDLTLDQSRQIP